jgi:hypothetical protein
MSGASSTEKLSHKYPAVFWGLAKRLEISLERLTGIKIANI